VFKTCRGRQKKKYFLEILSQLRIWWSAFCKLIVRQDVCRFKNVKDYINGMFPYNDEENAFGDLGSECAYSVPEKTFAGSLN